MALHYAATEPLALEEVRGDVDSGLGWWSTRFEQREPAWLLGARAQGPVPIAIATLLTSSRPQPEVEAFTVSLSDTHVDVRWTNDDQLVQVELDRRAAGAASRRVGGS